MLSAAGRMFSFPAAYFMSTLSAFSRETFRDWDMVCQSWALSRAGRAAKTAAAERPRTRPRVTEDVALNIQVLRKRIIDRRDLAQGPGAAARYEDSAEPDREGDPHDRY